MFSEGNHVNMFNCINTYATGQHLYVVECDGDLMQIGVSLEGAPQYTHGRSL